MGNGREKMGIFVEKMKNQAEKWDLSGKMGIFGKKSED